MYPFFPKLPSHPGCQITWSRCPCWNSHLLHSFSNNLFIEHLLSTQPSAKTEGEKNAMLMLLTILLNEQWINSPRQCVHQFSSVQFSCSVMSDSLPPHGLQHARPPCPSPDPGVYSNSCPLSGWCHTTISSSVVPFSSFLQSFPASGSSQMSQFFVSSSRNIGASISASVLPMKIQDWFPLGLIGLISVLSKGLSRVFSNTPVQKHQFFSAQLSL